MFRTLIYLVLTIFVLSVVRMLVGVVMKGVGEMASSAGGARRTAASGAPQRPPDPPQRQGGVELKRDPVCGMFVPVSTAVHKTVDGRSLYFCSIECRDKYAA